MSENEEIEADEDSERKIANMKQKASRLDEERAGNLSETQKIDLLIAFQRLKFSNHKNTTCYAFSE